MKIYSKIITVFAALLTLLYVNGSAIASEIGLTAFPADYSMTAKGNYIEAARYGDADAMFQLGLMHYHGLNAAQNEQAAKSFIRHAADKGHFAANQVYIQIWPAAAKVIDSKVKNITDETAHKISDQSESTKTNETRAEQPKIKIQNQDSLEDQSRPDLTVAERQARRRERQARRQATETAPTEVAALNKPAAAVTEASAVKTMTSAASVETKIASPESKTIQSLKTDTSINKASPIMSILKGLLASGLLLLVLLGGAVLLRRQSFLG